MTLIVPDESWREPTRAVTPLLRKLAHFTRLTMEEREAIAGLLTRGTLVPANTELVRVGEKMKHAVLIAEGWALRHRLLENGRRQVINFLLPGDMFDLCAFLLSASDHTVSTITPAVVFHIPPRRVIALFSEFPRLGATLWKSGLQEEAILRERIVSLGRRTATERMAHLLFELWRRTQMISPGNDQSFTLPITQNELADALGLSSVHVSRTLRRLRERGLVRIEGRRLTILRPADSEAYGEFDEKQLQNGTDATGLGMPRLTLEGEGGTPLKPAR